MPATTGSNTTTILQLRAAERVTRRNRTPSCYFDSLQAETLFTSFARQRWKVEDRPALHHSSKPLAWTSFPLHFFSEEGSLKSSPGEEALGTLRLTHLSDRSIHTHIRIIFRWAFVRHEKLFSLEPGKFRE